MLSGTYQPLNIVVSVTQEYFIVWKKGQLISSRCDFFLLLLLVFHWFTIWEPIKCLFSPLLCWGKGAKGDTCETCWAFEEDLGWGGVQERTRLGGWVDLVRQIWAWTGSSQTQGWPETVGLGMWAHGGFSTNLKEWPTAANLFHLKTGLVYQTAAMLWVLLGSGVVPGWCKVGSFPKVLLQTKICFSLVPNHFLLENWNSTQNFTYFS